MQEKWISVQYPKNYSKKQILDWVKENIKGRYHLKPGSFHFTGKFSFVGLFGMPYIKFEDPADAMAFKLRWI